MVWRCRKKIEIDTPQGEHAAEEPQETNPANSRGGRASQRGRTSRLKQLRPWIDNCEHGDTVRCCPSVSIHRNIQQERERGQISFHSHIISMKKAERGTERGRRPGETLKNPHLAPQEWRGKDMVSIRADIEAKQRCQALCTCPRDRWSPRRGERSDPSEGRISEPPSRRPRHWRAKIFPAGQVRRWWCGSMSGRKKQFSEAPVSNHKNESRVPHLAPAHDDSRHPHITTDRNRSPAPTRKGRVPFFPTEQRRCGPHQVLLPECY